MKLSTRARAAKLVGLLGVLVMTCSHAQDRPGYVYLLGNSLEPDDSLTSDSDIGGQVGVGRALGNYWNIEGYFQVANSDGNVSQRYTALGADLQLVIARDRLFSPFLFAGIGRQTSRDDLLGRDRHETTSAGAGFRWKAFGSSDAVIRAEYRLRQFDAFGRDFDDSLIGLGIQMPIGQKRQRPTDSDGDGVNDSLDRCANTMSGAAIDEFGCELDTDADGVVDRLDQCPDTARGESVNASGCPLDSDNDGVSDSNDNCPNTYAGSDVDEYGCELDDDSDGIANRLDQCPETASGVPVDINGCEIKEEIRLQGVNFESNSDRLLAGAEMILDDAAATLQRNPTIRVEVAGYTDSDGEASYNESLSARRAITVRDYLITRGVSPDRMTTRGYGEAMPIASNATAQGKAENRRVVLRILD